MSSAGARLRLHHRCVQLALSGQRNSGVDPSAPLLMRVGMPHSGGRLTFHAFEKEYPVMVSANAFWNAKRGQFCVPDYSNLYELDFALDSAGFTAMRLWKAKGRQPGMAGIFPWTCSQYVEMASLCHPAWWAAPDLCCEPEIASNPAEVDYRIRATATLLEGTLQLIHHWQSEMLNRDQAKGQLTCCSFGAIASLLPPPVPVLQGWTIDDYLRSLDLTLEVWERWRPWLAPPSLIGLGSVCRRSLRHPKHGLLNVLAALDGRMPAGSRVHLFGVKGASLAHVRGYDWIASADSMAYDVRARRAAQESARSNTMTHRAAHMDAWMDRSSTLCAPAAGDQARLRFHFNQAS